MTGLWTYPWTLIQEGVDESLQTIAHCGVDSINLASRYHSVRSLQPRDPDNLFQSYSGGVYFEPNSELYGEIEPIVNDVEGIRDPLGEIATAAVDHGITANAWMVCNHNSALGAKYDHLAIEDAFGTKHTHSLCPSRGSVREYFEAVATDIASYDVNEIHLEMIGFPSVFHGHDTTFGHDKRQVLTSPTEEWLISQCFCEACRSNAKENGVDVTAARTRVREELQTSFDEPHSNPLSLRALCERYPSLGDLIDYRRTVIDDLLERIAAAVSPIPINVYLMDGFSWDPGTGWPAGVHLDDVERHADRVTALCYERDVTTIRNRLQTITRSVELPVDAGISCDPECIPSEEKLHEEASIVTEHIDGTLYVYHHSLLSKTQLQWIETL